MIIFIFIGTCFLEFGTKVNASPKTFYQVYLDGKKIGVISSKEKLEKYINDKNEEYKKRFNTDKIYSPQGLDVEKIVTYEGKISTIGEIYESIVNEKPFTVSGYQFTLKRVVEEEQENKDLEEVTKTTKLYIMNKKIFEDSITNVIKTFVGEEEYNAYKAKTQEKIVTTGSYIDSVYLEDDITIKEVKIPVTETIYTDASELTKFSKGLQKGV